MSIDIEAGQAKNIGASKERLLELATALELIGLETAGLKIREEVDVIWANTDALYCSILSLKAENNNDKKIRNTRCGGNNLQKRKPL